MTKQSSPAGWALALVAAFGAFPALARSGGRQDVTSGDAARSLAETRLSLGKWIETEQIISKERNDWQQGKEILVGRLDLVRQEVEALEGKIAEAQGAVDAAEKKRANQPATIEARRLPRA